MVVNEEIGKTSFEINEVDSEGKFVDLGCSIENNHIV
jgi:hypothetical protein